MTYTPTPEDIGWAQKMLGLIRDGGALIYPGWLLKYRVDHQRHTLTLESETLNLSSLLTHQRTKVVFEKLGYTVIDQLKGDGMKN